MTELFVMCKYKRIGMHSHARLWAVINVCVIVDSVREDDVVMTVYSMIVWDMNELFEMEQLDFWRCMVTEVLVTC